MAQEFLDLYRDKEIASDSIYPQSFDLEVIQYWIKQDAEFAKNAVYLDGQFVHETFDPEKPENLEA